MNPDVHSYISQKVFVWIVSLTGNCQSPVSIFLGEVVGYTWCKKHHYNLSKCPPMVIFPILFHDPELPISSNAGKVVALVLSIFLQSKAL